jgi:hypothetical protein
MFIRIFITVEANELNLPVYQPNRRFYYNLKSHFEVLLVFFKIQKNN